MRVTRRRVLLGLVTALVAACSPHRPGGPAPIVEGCAPVFRVDNEGPEAIAVFLHRGAVVRLGTVPASRSVRLTSLAARVTGTGIRLIARPVSGGRSVMTDELRLGAGDHVRWTVTHPLEHSSITAVIDHERRAWRAEGCGSLPGRGP